MSDNIQMRTGEESRPAGGPNRAVLIVEDSENAADMLDIALQGIPGVSVLMASSGVEALRILSGGGSEVQVIVTDLNMPRMDGYELIRRIRGDQKLSGTPIIVVSADTDPATPERVAELGEPEVIASVRDAAVARPVATPGLTPRE